MLFILGIEGRKSTPPSEGETGTPTNWKYILIAAILAASILGIFFAATTGIFSDNPAPAASTSQISGASQPATNPSIVLADNEDDNKITKATKIPNPNEITPYKTLIDISNPSEFIKTDFYTYGLIITDIEIRKRSNEIEVKYMNIGSESIIIRPVKIFFFNEDKKEIDRKQWCCKYRHDGSRQVEFEHRIAYAHCQWPEDFCYTAEDEPWNEYWKKRLGKKQQPQKVGSTEYEEIIPTIKPERKYSFTVNCEIPPNTKYIKIK